MAASRSSPSPPPSAGGAAHIALFLDSDLGTHLALNPAADSTFGGLKAQVAVEHADAFPDIGPVLVKSFEVQRKGAMYRLSDSMRVKSTFSKVNAENFLHVNMTTAEADTRHCRDKDRGRASDALPPMLKGGEDDGACVTVHAHDVHPPFSSQHNTERKSTTVCLATDVRTTEGVNVNSTSVTLVGKEVKTREENLLHSVEDCELRFVSGDKQMNDLSGEKDCKKSRMTGSFDTSAVDPIGETNNSKTRDVENLDKLPLETSTNSHGVLSSTSCHGDVKRKKKRSQEPESSKDDPIQGAAKSSGLITNAGLTQSTGSHCLDANQITLGNIGEEKNSKKYIGEETADEKYHCRREKAAVLFSVSTQGVSVHDPSNVKQGDSDVMKTPSGDGKRKKKKRRHLECSKDEPTQDVTKSSGVITNGSSIQNSWADPLNSEQTTTVTIGEATVSDCRKVDETVDEATTDVITEVLADSSSKVLNGDPLMEQTKGCASAALRPSAIQSDVPISSPSTKSNGKPVKILSTALGLSHSSDGLSDENACTELRESDSSRRSEKISDLKNVLTENTAVPADGRTKSTKRQRKKVSLKHAPTDSGKGIQSLGDQARHVLAEDLESNKADTQFQHAGCIEPTDLPESHVHTDKTSLADHVGTGNVGMPCVSAQNMNRGDGNVKKGKRKSKRKSDLAKPESLKTYGGNQDTDNCPQGLMHSDVQKGRVEQGNAKENKDEVIIQNDSSMLQQETEDATRDSTLQNKLHQSLSAAQNLNKHPLEASTNSHGVLSSTSCQQGLDGNVKDHSVKPESPIITQKNTKRKKSQSVTSKGVCAHELTEPSTGAVEVPKATGEDLLHENQGLQGDGASNVEMTSRDKTNVIPPDMLPSSSQQHSGSQVTKHVQLGTDAEATSDPAAELFIRELYKYLFHRASTSLFESNPDMFLQKDSFRNGPTDDH